MASSPVATSLFLLLISSSVAIRPSPDLLDKPTSQVSALLRSFSRAPTPTNPHRHGCSNGRIDVAMTLDFNSLRGLVSSVGSILSHSSCPYNLRFHFLASPDDDGGVDSYRALLEFIFPWLSFRISTFEQKAVQALVERKLAHDSLSYARLPGRCPAVVGRQGHIPEPRRHPPRRRAEPVERGVPPRQLRRRRAEVLRGEGAVLLQDGGDGGGPGEMEGRRVLGEGRGADGEDAEGGVGLLGILAV